MAATRKTAQATLEPASRKKATDKPLAGKPAAGSADAPANGAAGTIRRRNVEKILKAAESVFAKKGFAGASTAEIARKAGRSEEHTSELQSLMRISYAVFCLKKKTQQQTK